MRFCCHRGMTCTMQAPKIKVSQTLLTAAFGSASDVCLTRRGCSAAAGVTPSSVASGVLLAAKARCGLERGAARCCDSYNDVRVEVARRVSI